MLAFFKWELAIFSQKDKTIFSQDKKTGWHSLWLRVSMILTNEKALGGGQIEWVFPRAHGQLPRPGREYAAGIKSCPPEAFVNDLIEKVPALFRAFDAVVARGGPPSRFNS